MSRFHAAHDDLGVASSCLMAYRSGERGRDARVGAMLEAEFYALIRGFMKG